MRRTTPLTAAGLLGLALLAPTTAAQAAGETCRGKAATIVGTEGRTLAGTEGPDVIVTNGATRVRALGGDDLVCTSGKLHAFLQVHAGDGDDVVDGTGSPRQRVFAELGSGADTFSGGGAADRVTVTYPDAAPGPDVIHGAGGSDALMLETGPGAAVVDNATGRFTSAGQVLTRWTGLEEFWLDNAPTPRELTFVGSDADELVVDWTFAAVRVDIDLAGGDDSWLTGVTPVVGSRLRGGAGTDLVQVASRDAGLDLDLRSGLLEVGSATPYEIATVDFEDADLFAEQVTLAGTDGPNDLGLTACTGSVRGRAGDDTVKREYDSMFETEFDCGETMRINGGAGDDDLSGSRGSDRILGGAGRDRLRGGFGSDRLVGGRGHDDLAGQADGDTLLGGRGNDFADGGRGGRDVCRAERKRQCER